MSNELARMSMVMSTALGGKQSKAEEMLADPRDTNAVGEILATITNMESEERKLLDVRLKNLRFFAQMTLGACVLAVVVCGGILGFVFWLVRRETARRESELLQTCRNTREALAIAGKHLTHLLPDMSGTIGLFNEARDQIEISQTFGNGPFVETFAPDDCWSLRRGRLHVSSPGSTEPSCGHCDTAKNFLCLPMMAQGETLGVLSVGTARAGDFSLAEHRTLQTITEQLSLALANLLMQETLRNQSLRDALTGLFNRRYLDDTLAREIGRARRNTLALSVIMIDLDHFKRFNDTNGHEGGDALLAEFGQTLSRVVRGEDIACRFGGEEFAVILPGADLAAALQRAEELRTAVTRMSVKLRGATLAPVTASLGVASLHDHGKTDPDLLKAADEALYEAKKEGRNRVAMAQRFGEHASPANAA
jgi:diguanylate cyclase (GGDEF)-like protein